MIAPDEPLSKQKNTKGDFFPLERAETDREFGRPGLIGHLQDTRMGTLLRALTFNNFKSLILIVWRWTESRANRSPREIPVNREFYREKSRLDATRLASNSAFSLR